MLEFWICQHKAQVTPTEIYMMVDNTSNLRDPLTSLTSTTKTSQFHRRSHTPVKVQCHTETQKFPKSSHLTMLMSLLISLCLTFPKLTMNVKFPCKLVRKQVHLSFQRHRDVPNNSWEMVLLVLQPCPTSSSNFMDNHSLTTLKPPNINNRWTMVVSSNNNNNSNSSSLKTRVNLLNPNISNRLNMVLHLPKINFSLKDPHFCNKLIND